jgi:hypothetical protein
MHEGLEITVQQYGFAVIFWWVFSMFGAAGLYVMMLGLNLIICILIYKICMLLSNKNENLSLLIMIVTDLSLTLGFVTTRAQMVSYVVILAVIYVLELYVKTGKWKYLWWIPVLSLIQINMHASLWWMIFLIGICYVVDSLKISKRLQGYKTWPLIVVGLIAFGVGFVNPYGWKMVTFIFTSYGANEIVRLVSEMRAFSLTSIFGTFMYISIAAVVVLYAYGNKKLVRARWLLMFLGFLALGLNTVKGMSEVILVMFLPMALLYKNVRIEKVLDAEIARRAVMLCCGVVAVAVSGVLFIVVPAQVRNEPDSVLVVAMDAIDADVGDGNKDALKVYVGYNWGGYVEYRGYKAYLDPRAEVFLKKNNKKKDILEEREGIGKDAAARDFLKEYDFDYLLIDEREKILSNEVKDDHIEIFSDEGGKFKVFKK